MEAKKEVQKPRTEKKKKTKIPAPLELLREEEKPKTRPFYPPENPQNTR